MIVQCPRCGSDKAILVVVPTLYLVTSVEGGIVRGEPFCDASQRMIAKSNLASCNMKDCGWEGTLKGALNEPA